MNLVASKSSKCIALLLLATGAFWMVRETLRASASLKRTGAAQAAGENRPAAVRVNVATQRIADLSDGLPADLAAPQIGNAGDGAMLVAQLVEARADDAVRIVDRLMAGGRESEKSLMQALQGALPAPASGRVANLLGRMGSDEGIQAVMTTAMSGKDAAVRAALMEGLAAGVGTPEAAGLLASAALVTDDPAILAPVIETVGRLGDGSVVRDLRIMHGEEGTRPEQRVILEQMIGGIRSAPAAAALTETMLSDQAAPGLREAARQALRAMQTQGAPDAEIPK
jgi:hypothetical protein